MGEELSQMGIEELKNLETKLDTSLKSVRARKVNDQHSRFCQLQVSASSTLGLPYRFYRSIFECYSCIILILAYQFWLS